MFTNLMKLPWANFNDHNFSLFPHGYIQPMPKDTLENLIKVACYGWDDDATDDPVASQMEAESDLDGVFEHSLNPRACAAFFRSQPTVPAIERDYYLSKLCQFLWLIALECGDATRNFNLRLETLERLLDSIPEDYDPSWFDWRSFLGEVHSLCETRREGDVLGALGNLDRFLQYAESKEAKAAASLIGGSSSSAPVRPGKRRGRRPNQERSDAIRRAIGKYHEEWRDHLSGIFKELDSSNVPLGRLEGMQIHLEGDQAIKASKWDDLDLAVGDQRKQIIDALRKYAD
jgi:hypothetical protein